jgi:hypothetical protein
VTGFVAAAREDGTLRNTAVAALAVALAFRVAFGESWMAAAAVATAGAVASLASDYADHRGVPAATRSLALGGALVPVAGGWLAAALPAVPPLAAVGLAAGAWLVLDGWTARRYGLADATEPPGDGFEDEFDGGFAANVRAFHDLGAVGRAVDDGARTPAEIAAKLDRPEADIREELDRLERADVVEQTDGEYHLTGPDWRVRSWPCRLVRRAGRPLVLLARGGA